MNLLIGHTIHQPHRTVMTKRKRTPSPSPAPRKRVIFEVPLSLWRFQAIARELARQSELLVQGTENAQDQQSSDLQRVAAGAPHFDAQTFQTNALRFSPYSHQPFLPSQPWPQTIKPTSGSLGANSNVEDTADSAMSRDGGAPQEGHTRQISAGPDDQLFDELNDALQAEDDEIPHDPGHQTPYLMAGNRTTFDPRFQGEWNGMRHEPYQPFMQSYPQIPSSAPSQPAFSSTLAHHPPRNNSNNFIPKPSTNPPPPSFYHPKPQNGAQTKSNMPGYYKSSLKLWSQEDQTAHPHPHPHPPPSQPPHHFGSMNNPFPQVTYSEGPAYPPPQPLASTPVNAYTNYGGTR